MDYSGDSESEITPQAADVSGQHVMYSSPGGGPLRGSWDVGKRTPQAASINRQSISHSSRGNTTGSVPKDTGVVIHRQRTIAKNQAPKETYLCVFLGERCEFMPDKSGFKNCAKVKEDGLRHINAFQCDNCGQRFGKRYGQTRHEDKCTKDTKDKIPPVCPGLALGLERFEKAKKYENLKSVSDECKLYCDMDEIREKQHEVIKNKNKKAGANVQKLQSQNKLGPSRLTPAHSQSLDLDDVTFSSELNLNHPVNYLMCYPETAITAYNSDMNECVRDTIYNNTWNIQAAVNTQQDPDSFPTAEGQSFDTPTGYEGFNYSPAQVETWPAASENMATGRTITTTNLFTQHHDIAYYQGAYKYSMNTTPASPAMRSTTEPLDLLPVTYNTNYQPFVHSVIPSYDPSGVQELQTRASRLGLDSNGSHQEEQGNYE